MSEFSGYLTMTAIIGLQQLKLSVKWLFCVSLFAGLKDVSTCYLGMAQKAILEHVRKKKTFETF